MSVSFSIQNKKKLLGYAKPISVQDCLELLDSLEQFNFNETDENIDIEKFYASSIKNFDCLLLGIRGKSGRGFELSYENDINSYVVRVNTPATSYDWQTAIEVIKALSYKFNSNIICENGEVYSAETIDIFDYNADILAGLKNIHKHINSEELTDLVLQGVNHDCTINKELFKKIYTSEDSVKSFSDFLVEVQNIDAYFAQQMLFSSKDDKGSDIDEKTEVVGIYVLSEDVRTVLPFKPVLSFENYVACKDKQVEWNIYFYFTDEVGNTQYPYTDFIEKLPKEKYSFIDANNIVVEPFSKQEILDFMGIEI
ncbi:DUF4299 family protein [Actinomyces sp. zg-332]|uniref:DUF4299 family protein n=1 Tax=Actinomyces sp. zg-332 TaxID=2708340 RepID=UPI0014245CDD|nr:DUF4299 family protein [Actinomyces sp. zg-332]QPK94161.1 DUF4299 family protein [Actinomyces sp. zg-332]